ncbi:Na(+)/H(+) antiporter subunit D [Salinisphaera sp. T31B1]|uniref:Na(+)/H(+) antiporter subunit D n=1 Tax=Salinisphaera sp. T31B1 TaxID=727963 RepID=UPI00333F947F
MPAWLNNPAVLLMLAGCVLPVLPYRARMVVLLGAPVAGLVWLWNIPMDTQTHMALLDYSLVPLRMDGLAFTFGVIFHIAAFISGLYMVHTRSRLEPAAALLYAGSAIGAVLAGDLITLFLFWEVTAIASALLLVIRGLRDAMIVARRYLLVQVGSGLLLMAGAAIHIEATGDVAFNHIGLDSPGGWLIFFAFGVKAAFPLLHNWLQDAYPAASATGTVVLSAFTTKMAIYALARGYAGTELLIPIGATMTLFPILYAMLENDLRRVLSYSLNVQLGFMVVGVGIGTQLAINGAAAHAVTHILYKALLFMAIGAVLRQTGHVRATELGGLARQMPWTTAFCVIGAASISAFPFMAGFVSKSLILSAVAHEHWPWTWIVLTAASAGALLYVGIKIPYFAFFAPNDQIRCKEPPRNMQIAMGLTAAACLLLGFFPTLLYSILPYPVDYQPYTFSHIVTQMQLLAFSALAFWLAWRAGLYPRPKRAVHLDSDWTYRWVLPRVGRVAERLYRAVIGKLGGGFGQLTALGMARLRLRYDGTGVMSRTWGTGWMVLWVAILLVVYLLAYY